ncbi:HK97 gp10 family phage protein [Microbacterium trichothecenolyticum]
MKLYPIRDPIAEAAADGLREGARDVTRDAKRRVPVDDAELRNSGGYSQNELEAIVRFTAPHAWLQHERLDYEHTNGGEAKYLENAATEYPLAEPVANHVKARLGGG